jgi:hypothetical protein
MTALELAVCVGRNPAGRAAPCCTGCTITERFSLELPDGVKVPVRHMSQTLVEP